MPCLEVWLIVIHWFIQTRSCLMRKQMMKEFSLLSESLSSISLKKKIQRQKSSQILENVASQKRHALLPELRTYIGYLWLLFPLFLKPKQMFKPRILRQWSNRCPFSYCNPQDTCRNENPGYENIFSEYIIHSNVSIQSESNFIHPWSRRVRKMTVLREQTLFLSKSLTFVARSAAVLLSQRKRRLFLFLITQNL